MERTNKNTFPNIQAGYRPRPVPLPGEGITVLLPERVSIGRKLAKFALNNLERLGLHKPVLGPQVAAKLEQTLPAIPNSSQDHPEATSVGSAQETIQVPSPVANTQNIIPIPPDTKTQADIQPPHFSS